MKTNLKIPESKATLPEERPEKIVFFDGVCHFCDRTVQKLLKWDHRKIFRYAPLQGKTASRLLPKMSPQELLSGMILYHGGETGREIYQGFAAVVEITALLYPRLRLLLSPLRYFPCRQIGGFFYRIVATNRYRWFGRLESCRIPTPDMRRLFLD